jgi:hypothetical protein
MTPISRQWLIHRHKCMMRALIWYPQQRLKRRLPAVVSSEQTSDDEMVSRGKADGKRC